MPYTMSPATVASLIAGAGFILSMITSVWITGTRWGSVQTRLAILEKAQDNLATKEQLAGVKEDVAEIKGMFRMTLADGGGREH